MAAGGNIVDLFATLGFKINKGDIQKVDKQLDILEKRAKKISEESLSNIRMNISRFSFSENFNTRLRKALEARMKVATKDAFKPNVKFGKISVPVSGIKFSDDFNTRLHNTLKQRMRVASTKGVSPEIRLNKFNVDRNALLRDMRSAVHYVENNLRIRLRSDIVNPSVTPTGAAGGRSGAGGGVSRFGAGMGVGAAAGSLGRGFIPGLGAAFAVSQLNQLNQQLIGQNLAATAVFGNQQSGQEQLAWLRDLGNEIGFDYRSQANPYLKMQASAMTAGMDISTAQHIFQSLAEYGRVMGLDDESMKGTMRAVEQMLNKGQVYAEELKMQLAERFPAAIQLMAEAVAGGDTQELMAMMERGEIVSLEALPKFADILARQARVGGALEEAMRTSLAEQMRFNNTFNDLVMFFSESGFEEGQAGIFRTMAIFFEQMRPLLQGFGQAWKYVGDIIRVPLGLLADLSTVIEYLSENTSLAKGEIVALGAVLTMLAFPLTRKIALVTTLFTLLEDFTAFLTGRDSLLGQILGDDAEETRKNFNSVFKTMTDTVGLLYDRVKDLFDLLGRNMDGGWIGFLNTTLKDLEEMLYRINLLLGGPTREQIAHKKFLQENPEIAAKGGVPSTENQSYLERNFGGFSIPKTLATVVDKHPSFWLHKKLGIGDMLTNMSNYSENFANDEQLRQESVTRFRRDLENSTSGGSGSQSTTSIGKIEINVSESENPERTADVVMDRVRNEMFTPVSNKAAGASQ